jgi:hypothetical protein
MATFDPKLRTSTLVANSYLAGRREIADPSFGAAARSIPIQQAPASQC